MSLGMTLDGLFVALLCTLAAGGGFIAIGPRLLLSWYLREIRRMEIPEDRGEAIAVYPFA